MRLVKPQGRAALAAGVLALAAAGCGSGGKAPGVVLAPEGGATAEQVTSTPSTPTTPTTSAVSTPSTGPLSRPPVIHKLTGTPPTHLVTKDLIQGVGTTAKPGSSLVVNYVGALYKTGKVFDSSFKHHQTFGPFTLSPTGGVIQGWVQGLVGMKVGGRRELIIPPSLAYKNVAQPGIPANSTLVFVVDLLSANG